MAAYDWSDSETLPQRANPDATLQPTRPDYQLLSQNMTLDLKLAQIGNKRMKTARTEDNKALKGGEHSFIPSLDVPRYEHRREGRDLALLGETGETVVVDRSQLLGIGRYSNVYRGHIRKGDHDLPVAVKLYNNTGDWEKLEVEASLLSILRGSAGIIGLHGRIQPSDPTQLGLALELAGGGNLAELIFSQETPSLRMILGWTRDIVFALKSLEAAGILHHDIKPHNMLLSTDRQHLFLADFGCGSQISSLDSSHELEGTLGYTAPELLSTSPSSAKNISSDVYSFGVTLYSILTGREPFANHERSGVRLMIAIQKGFWKSDQNPWKLRAGLEDQDHVIVQLQNISTLCTDLDPQRRPSPTQLYQTILKAI